MNKYLILLHLVGFLLTFASILPGDEEVLSYVLVPNFKVFLNLSI